MGDMPKVVDNSNYAEKFSGLENCSGNTMSDGKTKIPQDEVRKDYAPGTSGSTVKDYSK